MMLRESTLKAGDILREQVTSPLILQQVINGTDALQRLCYALSNRAGWWEGKSPFNPETFATKISLIHSEISEALEGGRKREADHHLPERSAVEVELADAIIRIMDLAGAMNLDLAGAIVEKLAYNLSRADHKPEARAAENGKLF